MLVKNSELPIKETKSECLSSDSSSIEDADFRSLGKTQFPESTCHGQITRDKRRCDFQKTWHEKWWGDIVIGLVGVVFVFMAWIITM